MHFFFIYAAIIFLLSPMHASAACAPGTGMQPSGVVGLQLFYPDDPRSWQWARELGTDWLRLELRWDAIEPAAGEFNWSNFDRVMERTDNYKVMILFNHPPDWAQKDQSRFPANAARAAGAAAARYSHRNIAAWEIFNEPNLPGYGWPLFSSGAEASAILYSKTLAASAAAIRRASRETLIVSAGLSPHGMEPERFLRLMLRHTPDACYDAIGLHPYGEGGKFGLIAKNAAFLLASENAPPKPVWYTEYGTDNDGLRAEILRQLFSEAEEVPIIFWFMERDITGLPSGGHYGLRTANGDAKPDFFLFKILMAEYTSSRQQHRLDQFSFPRRQP